MREPDDLDQALVMMPVFSEMLVVIGPLIAFASKFSICLRLSALTRNQAGRSKSVQFLGSFSLWLVNTERGD
ncbi:hypothetical protein BTW08_01110 [Salinicola sp. MH3R3-1]|nr:hypothetical protein BTW08_01110 [Salinicola sp. MH3R3-1]